MTATTPTEVIAAHRIRKAYWDKWICSCQGSGWELRDGNYGDNPTDETVKAHATHVLAALTAAEGKTHVDAWADSGDGYTTHGRQYVITCLWCDGVYFGPTKSDALGKYRIHEREMHAAACAAWAAADAAEAGES